MSGTVSPPGDGLPSYAPEMSPHVMTSGDILAAYDEPAPTRRAPWLVAGGAGLLVLGLVGGVTYGVGALSGGGSQTDANLAPIEGIGMTVISGAEGSATFRLRLVTS